MKLLCSDNIVFFWMQVFSVNMSLSTPVKDIMMSEAENLNSSTISVLLDKTYPSCHILETFS